MIQNESLKYILNCSMKTGNSVKFRVAGTSMMPFIRSEDIITLSPYTSKSPETGDVVAFSKKETNIRIHRIVGKNGDKYLIKGDNLKNTDGYYSSEDIIGHVIQIDRQKKTMQLNNINNKLIAYISRLKLFYCLTISIKFYKHLVKRINFKLLALILHIQT